MFKDHSSYPKHDTSLSPDAEPGQIMLQHNVEKRCNAAVLKLPKWGHKGVTVEMLRIYLNKLLHVNFNYNHMSYALEWLFNHEVIGKRGGGRGEEAIYFARPSTAERWAKVRVLHRSK